MGLTVTQLSFDIYDTNQCTSLGIFDSSFYSSNQTISNATLQIISPFDDTPVELDYYKNALTVINSNNLKITNVNDLDDLSVLPDGLYTAKISICPEDVYWFEKSWYRTCILDCKYDQAFLKLKIQSCENCFSEDSLKRLDRAKIYIYGCKINAKNSNNKEAKKLYSAAWKILENLLNCDDCKCNK